MTRDEMIDLLVHHSIWFPMARGAEIEQTIDRLFHFARIVAEAERDACYEIAQSQLRNMSMLMSNPPKSSAAWEIANLIQARNNL